MIGPMNGMHLGPGGKARLSLRLLRRTAKYTVSITGTASGTISAVPLTSSPIRRPNVSKSISNRSEQRKIVVLRNSCGKRTFEINQIGAVDLSLFRLSVYTVLKTQFERRHQVGRKWANKGLYCTLVYIDAPNNNSTLHCALQ